MTSAPLIGRRMLRRLRFALFADDKIAVSHAAFPAAPSPKLKTAHSNSAYPPLYNWRAHPTVFDLDVAQSQVTYRVTTDHNKVKADVSAMDADSSFETTIRVLGGLNSVHSLTQNRRFLAKAIEMADALLPAFTQAPAGIPYSEVNFMT
ncbi:mannosyl-oligosaccharide alpha-1,2-mannosidase [Sorochytrium milnesiophthora]